MMEREPYPGLRPFLRDEVDIFFGRERQIDRMIEQLREHRFLAVTGTSGSGKSSLVRTGLLSALEAGFLDSAGGRWRILDIRPGSKPFAALVPALLQVMDLEATPTDIELARAALERGPLSISEFMERVPGGTSDSLLIVVDQFEELFRFSGRVIRDEVEAFVALLMGSVSQTKVPIYVVLTMRSDFLGDCARFEGLPELINRSQYLTPRMSREEYRHAIEDPARVLGGRVTPSVTSRLLNDMVNMPDQLCLIQHALLMMWRHAKRRGQPITEIGLVDYEAIGGLAEAISRHADEVLDAITLPSAELGTAEDTGLSESTTTAAAPDKLAITERLFRRLTEGSGRESDIRRPTAFGELLEVIDCSEADLRSVIEEFRAPGNNFLTPLPHIPIEHDTVIDICHESLIRQWKRLRDWTDRESEAAAAYRRLEQTAILWRQGKAGLWPLPDVERAIIWRREQKPTHAWAKQYGKHFDTAISFLEESRKANQTALRRRRAVVFASIIGPIMLAAVIYGWWASAGKNDKLARQSQELAFQRNDLARLQKETNRALQSARDWRSGALKSQFHAILASAESELGKGRINRARALTLEGGDLMRAADPSQPFQRDAPDYRRYINTLISALRVDGPEIYVDYGTIEGQQVSGAYSSDSRIFVWTNSNHVYFSDARTGIAIKRYATADRSQTLSLAPNGRLAALLGKDAELFELDRGKLQSASNIISRERIGAVAFAETAQGIAVVGITRDGEFRAWNIAEDGDRVEPISLLRKTSISAEPSLKAPTHAISCAGSRCITFDGTRLRLFDLNAIPSEVAHGSVAADPKSGDSPLDESKGKPSNNDSAGQTSVLLMNDTVILGIGTNWSSYKIDETSDQPSIVAKPAGDWLKNSYVLLMRGTSGNVLGVDKIEGRTRFTSSKLGADEPTETVNGMFDAQAIVAVSPDGASALAVEESEDKLTALKVVQFTSTTDACGDCLGVMTGRTGETYLIGRNAILKFDPERKAFVPKLTGLTENIRKVLNPSQLASENSPNSITSGDGSSSAVERDNPEIDLRLIGWESDLGADRIYLLFSGRVTEPQTIIVASFDVVSDTVTILKEGPKRGSAGSAEKSGLRQSIDRKSFPKLVINSRDRRVPAIFVSPAIDAPNELKWTRGPFARVRIADQTAVSFNGRGELEIIRANEASASQRASDPIRLSSQDIVDIDFIDNDTVFVAYRDGLIEFRDISPSETRTRAIRLEMKIEIKRAFWSRTAKKLIVTGRRLQGRETTIVAWVEPVSGLITHLYERGNEVISVENPNTDTALVVGGGTYTVLSGMQTLESEKIEEYARAITPNWYSRNDIEKFGLRVLDDKMDQSAANPTLPECEVPAFSKVRETLGDDVRADRNKPHAYTAACSELHRANISDGFKAWILGQLTQQYLFGETKSNRNDVLRFELLRFGRDDDVASVNIADQLLLEGDRCNSQRSAALRQLQESAIVGGSVISPSYLRTVHDCDSGSHFDLKPEVHEQLEKLSAARDPIAHAILGMLNEHRDGSQEVALAHYEAASMILYSLRQLLVDTESDQQAWIRVEQEIGRRRSALTGLLGAKSSLRALGMARQLLGGDPAAKAQAMSKLYTGQTASARVISMSESDTATDADKAEQKLLRVMGKTTEMVSSLTELRYLIATRYLDRGEPDEAQKARARPLLIGILHTAKRTGAIDSFAAAVAPLALQYFADRPDSDGEAFGKLKGIAYDVVYRLSTLSPPRLTTEEWATNLDLFARSIPLPDRKSQTQIEILALGLKERDLYDQKKWDALREAQHRVYELLKQASSLDDFRSAIKTLSWQYIRVGARLYEARSTKEGSNKLSNDLNKAAHSILMEGVKLHALTESLFSDDASMLGSLGTGNSYAGNIAVLDRQFDTAVAFYDEDVRLRKAAADIAQPNTNVGEMWRNIAVAQNNLATAIQDRGDRAKSRLDASSDLSTAWRLRQSAVESWRAAKKAGSTEADKGLFDAFGWAVLTAIKLEKNEEALVLSFERCRSLSSQKSEEHNLLKNGSISIGYSVAAMFHDAQRAKGKNTTPTRCDAEAGHPHDPFLLGSGRYLPSVEADSAIEACDQALSKEPSNPRLIFQRGRALEKKGEKEASMADYQAASKMGYPISFNNIANRYSEDGTPKELMAQAPNLIVEFTNRTVNCCGRDAANYVLEKKTESGRLGINQAAIDLLDWAAELGDAAAHEDIARILAEEQTANLKREWAAMPPSERRVLRVLHLLIARRLYLEDKRHDDAQRATVAIDASIADIPPQIVADLRKQEAEWTRKGWQDMPAWLMPGQDDRDRSAVRRALGN